LGLDVGEMVLGFRDKFFGDNKLLFYFIVVLGELGIKGDTGELLGVAVVESDGLL
jgi:hypothetical protein